MAPPLTFVSVAIKSVTAFCVGLVWRKKPALLQTALSSALGGLPTLLITPVMKVLAAFVGPLTNASSWPLASAPTTPSGLAADPGRLLVDQLPTLGMVPKVSAGAPPMLTAIWACMPV